MNWLKNNPLGVALALACGVLLLVSAALAYTWSRPASSGAPAQAVNTDGVNEAQRLSSELGPISNYREVTDRPVFDATRRPQLAVDENGGLEEGPHTTVADAPEVKLTGIVITPEFSIATLTPLAGGESFIAREGNQLEGEYVGWAVVDIKPRKIRLGSLEGGEMEIDLQVNTRKINQPPKPEPVNTAAAATEPGEAAGAGDQPLSRAEEIRQRIAERRDELRRQSESRRSASSRSTQYQDAIRTMINRKNDNDENEEKNGGGGSDG